MHEETEMWLFKQNLTASAEAAVKSRVALLNSVNLGHEGALRTYSKVVNAYLRSYVIDQNIERLNNEVKNFQTRCPNIYVIRRATLV